MKNHPQILAGLLLLLLPMMQGCIQEYINMDTLSDEIEIHPKVVVPLIYGSLSLEDLISLVDSSEFIGEFDDGLIYVVYADKLISVAADTAVKVPEPETAEFFLEADSDIPIWLPVDTGDTAVLPTRFRSVDFTLEGNDRLDYILLKGGAITLELTSTFKHEGVMTISSEQIVDKAGIPFSTSIIIDDPSGNFTTTVHIPTDMYRIDPIVENDSNLVDLGFDLALINSGDPISPGEQCVIRVSFGEMGFYEIFGFIDSRDLLDESGSLQTLWPENPDLSSLEFADPRIAITTISSFGIPFQVELDSVIGTGIDGTQATLNLYDGNILEFRAPGLDQVGESVETLISIDNTNSNIQEFLAISPEDISYSILGRTSTTGGDSSHFILNESKMDVLLEFLLPLDFKTAGFGLSDTLSFVPGENIVDTTLVKGAYITVNTNNELPLEFELQVRFLDASYAVVDSVFDEQVPILGASMVDDNGKLLASTEESNTARLPAEKLVKLDNVSYMQIIARVETSDGGEPFVKIYSEYKLDFKITLEADFRINTSEL